MSSQDDLFQPVITLPEDTREQRYRRLVGLDHIKLRLRTEAIALADPAALDRWMRTHHPGIRPEQTAGALTLLSDRAPLIILGGDVGSGKSALAESFGCDLATTLNVPAYLYRLKLATRGSGLVGEMTALIGNAFDLLRGEAEMARGSNGIKAIQIFVVDEADALVQSREATQMHHEDRAGVDAFLAGIDSLAGTGLPLIVVLCTNRLNALDPAVRRRAAATFELGRPDESQRRGVLLSSLDAFSPDQATIDALVTLTGAKGGNPGYTYSDITQRLVPTAILRAFPNDAVTDELLLQVARDVQATPVFRDQVAS